MSPTRLLALLVVPGLALAACAEMKKGVDATEAAVAGSCPATEHQDWIGKSVSVLNDVALPEGTRVLFPTTPATMDYREERMNVEVDKSDVITRVFCG